MEVQFSPNPVDESNLLYKLQRKVKVFNTSDLLPFRGYNLITTSSKYGIVFVASPQAVLSAYSLKELINTENEPRHLSINLQVQPSHIEVNCDQEWLAVVGGQILLVYKVTDFQDPAVGPAISIRCEVNPSTFLSAIQWNPCVPDTIALVYFDGTLLVTQVNTNQKKQIQSNARCICWSPKGKQLVTGNSDGTLCQYKPDLSPMKSVPAPNLFQGAPVETLAIHWISTFQFAVVYRNASDNSRPVVTIVNTPKGGKPSCLNLEDICYSMGSNRPWYYYLQGLSQWNLIMGSSSNSMEIATMGSKDGANWIQWCQSDEARPELPLTDKSVENYPVGLCVDTAAVQQLPWGENEVLPPMPLLLAVSHTGVLTIFNIINLDKAAPQICTPVQALPLPEAALTSEIPNDVLSQPQQPAQEVTKPQPVVQQTQPQLYQQPDPVGQPIHQPVAQQAIAQQSVAVASTPSTGLFLEQALKSSNSQKPVTAVSPTVKLETNSPSAAEIEKSRAEAAAIKREQERVNKAKVDQELKNILIKEVNDFQSELHRFRVNTCESQIKIQQQLDAVKPECELQNMNGEQLKKVCGLEELRDSIVHLKLELVRACAVVAEARTHADAKEHHEWSQVDPLTTKRFSSIKQIAYYVQNQLDQAQRELDSKWNDMISKNQRGKGDRMLRPILDDVYQPLVEQQEILGRQKAVLRTLRSTMTECTATPLFRSTSILRSTPFKNKDPLSKLTKNILNMSIEPQDNKNKELSSQKLDALRDMLSNHRPKKIKPVSVEVRQYMENMRQRYENGVKERAEKRDVEKQLEKQEIEKQITLEVERQKIEAEIQEQAKIKAYELVEAAKKEQRRVEAQRQIKPQMKTEFPKPAPASESNVADTNKNVKAPVVSVPAFAPSTQPTKPAFAGVSKNLFGNVPKQEVIVPQVQPVKTEGSRLREQLQSDLEIPKICSPTAFTTPKSTSVFSSKPITEMGNMFHRLINPDTNLKPVPTSDETGEVVSNSTPIKTSIQPVKENKPLGSIFSLKPSNPTNVQNVPDIVKSQVTFGKTEPTLQTEDTQKPKEIVPKSEVTVTAEKQELKPFVIQSTTVPPSFSTAQTVFIVDPKKPNEIQIGSSLPTSFFTSSPTTAVSSTPVVTATVTIKASPKEPPKAQPDKEEKVIQSVPPKTESNTTPAVTSEPASPTAKSVFSTASKTLFSTSPEAKPSESQTTSPTLGKMLEATSTLGTAQSVFSAANSAFGSTASAAVEAAPAFGTTSSPSAVFGSAAQGAFGQTQGASTTQSLFGSPSTTPAFGSESTTASIFGPSNTVFGQPVFGGTAPAFGSSSPTSVFGSSTQSSVFGSTPTTQASVFGSSATTQASVFGSTPTTQASVFGSTPTTQASVFGSTPTTQASVFGSAPTTQASVFGSPPTTQASVFGSTPTTQASVFGSTTNASSGLFGDDNNLFSSASISTTSASQSGTSLFGGSTGFGKPNSNVFGGNSTPANIFGGGSSFNQKPPSGFWGGATNTTGFGSSGFGQTTTTTSFGTGSFSQPSTGQPFASPFSSPQQQSAPGFGGSSVFGGKPAFGSPPSFGGSAFGGVNNSPGFGSSATFGGGATFGGSNFGSTSPGKAFGAASPTGFGSPTQSNATFENLATQDTLTFGNLAQQQTPAATAFNTSPSFTGWRG